MEDNVDSEILSSTKLDEPVKSATPSPKKVDEAGAPNKSEAKRSAESDLKKPDVKRRKLTAEEKKQRDIDRVKREEEKQEKLRQKEAERVKREEEKRRKDEEKEQERVKKEEEKRKKDEDREHERVKKEEEKRKKDEEKEQERVKREDEKRKKEEERRVKEEERKQKEEEKEQQRLKREEEKQKREAERKQKQDEKDRERQKAEEKARLQQDFLKSFLNKTPTSASRKSCGSANASADSSLLDQSNASASESSPAPSGTPHRMPTSSEIEVIEISENDNPNPAQSTDNEAPKPKPARFEFKPMPFQVKNGMALAPVLRRECLSSCEKKSVEKLVPAQCPSPASKTEIVDLEKDEPEIIVCAALEVIEEPGVFEPYLETLKRGKGRKSTRTEVKHIREESDDIEIIDFDPKALLISEPVEHGQLKLRYKLLQFHDNRRPAYWGTWRKRPLKIKPRRPLAQEEELDYEFDSDDEWEDEPEDGEDLDSDKETADKEEDEKGGNEVEAELDEEDDWMVPHGYLSDGEGGDKSHLDKDTLKSREEEFYKELNRETKLGFPIIETENLSEYATIFVPKKTARLRNRHENRKSAKACYNTLKEIRDGKVVMEGDLLSSDEEDTDWEEKEDDSDDESSSDTEHSAEDGWFSGDEDLLALVEETGVKKLVQDETGVSADDEEDDEEDDEDDSGDDEGSVKSESESGPAQSESESGPAQSEDDVDMKDVDVETKVPEEKSEPGVAVQ